MPNIKSAKKRVKVNKTKAEANKARKSNLKTMIKKAELAAANNTADKETAVKTAIKKVYAAIDANDRAAATEALANAISAMAKAEAKGVYHKNTVSRKVSRMTLAVNKLA